MLLLRTKEAHNNKKQRNVTIYILISEGGKKKPSQHFAHIQPLISNSSNDPEIDREKQRRKQKGKGNKKKKMAATIFQRNKKAYLEEEQKLFHLLDDKSFQSHFQAWLDNTIAQLDTQYDSCEQMLSELQQTVAVDDGQYWNSKTITQHCNLYLDERRLIAKGQELTNHPSWPDVVQLVSTLHQLKSKSFVTPRQARFIEQCEKELKNVVFEPRELQYLTNALVTKLQGDSTTRQVLGELTTYQNAIDEIAPDLVQCEQLLEAALMNGEMALAEDISVKQLEMYEHMLKLIEEQYPVIHAHHSEAEDSQRRRRWAIFRMGNKDIGTVIQFKLRQVEACEEDLLKIRDQLQNYNQDDQYQRRRYETDRVESDKFLQQNKEKQQGVWNRMFELFQELRKCQDSLATLGSQRNREVERRLKLEEREAGRRCGHEAFIHAAAVHAQRLQDTIDNALAARDVAKALHDFVLDGCDSVTGKYDKQQTQLSEMLRLVQHHHFKRFTDYYVAASRYLYRKENKIQQLNGQIDASEMQRELHVETLDPLAKRFAQQSRDLQAAKREIAEDVVSLRHRLEAAEKAVTPTLRSFDFHKIPYVHPRDIVATVNTDRVTRILDHRETLTITAEQRLQAERELLSTMREDMQNTRLSMQEEKAKGSGVGKPKGPPPPAQFQRFQAILDKQLPTVTTSSSSRSVVGPSSAEEDRPPATAPAGAKRPAPPVASSGADSARVGSAPPAHNNVGANGSSTANNDAAAAMMESSSNRAAAPQRMEGASLRALYRYKARNPDELSFEKGDILVCISGVAEEGWYRGVCNQRAGLFPINYVTPLLEQ